VSGSIATFFDFMCFVHGEPGRHKVAAHPADRTALACCQETLGAAAISSYRQGRELPLPRFQQTVSDKD
jgi:hypothetical protein